MSSVETSPNGWPLLKDASYIADIPEYTERLATKLDSGDADVAAAVNAAKEAKEAAATAMGLSSQIASIDALYQAAGLVADAHTPLLAGEQPPVGTILKRRSWLLQGQVSGGGGGCWLEFPETFKGVTTIQYSSFVQNLYALYYSASVTGVLLRGGWPDGGHLANGATLKVFVTVEGW